MAEPVISAADKRHRHSSPAVLGSLGKATEKTDDPGCQGEAREQPWGRRTKTEWGPKPGCSRVGRRQEKETKGWEMD